MKYAKLFEAVGMQGAVVNIKMKCEKLVKLGNMTNHFLAPINPRLAYKSADCTALLTTTGGSQMELVSETKH